MIRLFLIAQMSKHSRLKFVGHKGEREERLQQKAINPHKERVVKPKKITETNLLD